jgi:hypothetical protein
MYKIDSPNSLNMFLRRNPNLRNKVVAGRFKMQNCGHCINSQPMWDSMLANVMQQYQIHPNTMFTEIDSQLTDDFISRHNLLTSDQQPFQVQGYPTHVFIVRGMVFPHESDSHAQTIQSMLDTLVKHKHLKRKQKKSKKSKTKKLKKK